MKLQAIMNRATAKQGTDLQDIARLVLDEQARPAALTQLGNCDPPVAADIALHVDLWLVDRRRDALRWIHDTGGTDLTLDDLDLIAELLLSACARLVLAYSDCADFTRYHQRLPGPFGGRPGTSRWGSLAGPRRRHPNRPARSCPSCTYFTYWLVRRICGAGRYSGQPTDSWSLTLI
jgi:hypothetical protein